MRLYSCVVTKPDDPFKVEIVNDGMNGYKIVVSTEALGIDDDLIKECERRATALADFINNFMFKTPDDLPPDGPNDYSIP